MVTKVIYDDYTPYGGCAEVWQCREPEVIIEGPAGTGKTRAYGEFIHWLCQTYPNTRVLVLRKTRASLTESWMMIFEDKVVPQDHPVLQGPKRMYRQSYIYPNGSIIILGGMDYPTRLFSTQYDFIYVNEVTELTEEEWESLHRALRNHNIPWQQLAGDCNPDRPTHWVNRRCDEKTVRIRTVHSDNPTNKDSYLLRLSNLSGTRRDRLYLGIWSAAEGMVYSAFDPDIHIIKVPDGMDKNALFAHYKIEGVFSSKDWGYRDPGVTQVWGLDKNGAMHMMAEHYMTGKTIDWWLDMDGVLQDTYRAEEWVCDPARPEFINQYQRAGMTVSKAINDIEVGLRRVEERLMLGENNKPTIFFWDNALRMADKSLTENKYPYKTTDEFESYVYVPVDSVKKTKEEPIDKFNHGMDAMRYAVMYAYGYSGHSIEIEATSYV